MIRLLTAAGLALVLSGCATFSARDVSAVPLAADVDLSRYAGDWYLIAHIPTSRDVGAHNAQEHYGINADGSIAITYRNRLGGFDGRKKLMTPTAFVQPDSGNALWAVRFGWYWPWLYEYRIAHLEADYSAVIVARSKRDFVWLFARSPQMSEADLTRYTALMSQWGYDTRLLERVPQQWPNPADGSAPVLGGRATPNK